MRLTSFEYWDHVGGPREWRLRRMPLKRINLLVGKNATGKSRAINVISSLALHLGGKRKEVLYSGSYRAGFLDGEVVVKYLLEVDAGRVAKEVLTVGDEEVLTRSAGGFGHIVYESVEGRRLRLKFKVEDSELGIVAKRDPEQHSFLERMHEWGAKTSHFQFGRGMGWENYAIFVKVQPPLKLDPERDQVPAILSIALRRFGVGFAEDVIRDMSSLGYDIESLSTDVPSAFFAAVPIGGELTGVVAKERELLCGTDQSTMSQGMFRALSLLIQLHYAIRCGMCACVLIDDIGEGLDFERSCDLVGLLRDKALRDDFQLIFSTNDRFVMNAVPLEEWILLRRKGNVVVAHNDQNSRTAFEKFEFTGLSNFDFFATDFLDEFEADANVDVDAEAVRP